MVFSLQGRGRIRGAIFAPLALCALASLGACSKFGRLPASEKGFTDVEFSGGKNARGLRGADGSLHRVGPAQEGGVVIWGVKSDGSSTFSLLLENDSEPASKDHIPNGSWNFYAVGWDDTTNNFEGTARCATASAELGGTKAIVDLNLTAGSCTAAAFGVSGFFSGGSPKPLRFIRCNTLPASVDGTQNCDGGATVGDFASFRVSLVEHELGSLGTQAANPDRLSSQCFNPGLTGSSSVGSSAMLLPVGASAGSPLIYEVKGFTDAACSANETTFTFSQGLGANAPANSFVGPAASFTSVYLVHGPPGPPSSFTLMSPGSSPGNLAQPVINVAGTASGDTVTLYTDASCTGVSGSTTAGGSSVNVTVSPALGADGIYNFWAKRSNASGTSACSTATISYTLDATQPTVPSLTGPMGGYTSTATYNVSVTLSDTPAAGTFTIGDITVTNGTPSGLSGAGTAWSFTVTPTLNTQQNISIAANAFTDTAGNGNTASSTLQITHDNIQPTVAVTTTQSSPFNGSTYPVTITFSESIPSFAIGSVSVTNGTKSNFAGSGTTYTLDITPTPNATSVVSVAASSTTDAAGNLNAASSPDVSIVHDNTVPSITGVDSSTVNGDYYQGDTISIQVSFQEAVTVAGGTPTLALNSGGTASYVSGSGTSSLTFSYTVGAGQNIGDLDYSGTGALSLNGATIKDGANNNALLTLVSPGASGSLGFNRNLIIHGVYQLTVAPAYSGFTNWNKYVKFTDSAYPIYNQPTPTACIGTEAGPYGRLNGCIHAGELRKVVVTGRTSCSNLNAHDQNDVFEWKCDDFGGTQAKFFSVRFKPGKGLKDLVSASAWLGNKVVVQDGATPIGESVNGDPWGWGNTVEALSTGASLISLDVSFNTKVLTVSGSQASRGYLVSGTEIAIVTLSGAELRYDEGADFNQVSGNACGAGAGTSVLICVDAANYIWLEGNIKGGNGSLDARTAFKARNLKFLRVHESDLHNMRQAVATSAIELWGVSSSMVSGLKGNILGGNGILWTDSSDKNRFENLRVAGITSSALTNVAFVTLTNSSDGNLINDFRISQLLQNAAGAGSTSSGIRVDGGTDNVIANGIVSEIKSGSSGTAISSGIFLGSGAAGTVVSQVTAMSGGDAGIRLSGADTSVVQYVTAAHNVYNGVFITGSNTDNNFFRGLALANHDSSFATDTSGVTGTGNVLRDSASGHNASNFAVDVSNASIGFTVGGYLIVEGNCGSGNGVSASCTGTGITKVASSFTSAWTGALYTDSKNDSDTGAAVAYGLVVDRQKFDHIFRAWGIDGTLGSIPLGALRGACISGNCAIWDWTLPGSGPLYNKSLNGSSGNPAFTTGSCPVNGNDTESVRGGTNNALKHAIELVDDDIGDNDGLCESGETCLFTPHVGAFQGSGGYTQPCSFAPGFLTGITLLQYSTL